MTVAMDPWKVYDELRGTYLRYLETSFRFKDPYLQKELREVLRDTAQPPLVREPILEVSPTFAQSSTIGELIDEGLLSSRMRNIEPHILDRPLYDHQERGLSKAIGAGRHLLVDRLGAA